jgi:hypothetical protein
MTAPRHAVFIIACVLIAPIAASGGAFAQSASQEYAQYRQSLLSEGWKPVTSYGLRTATGKVLYKYPEVVCGPELCNAKWRDRHGQEKLVTLQRGYDGADHRVAP